jgi:hypothetical protein
MDYILTSGSFFWVPMGNYYGKRPIFVIACLGLSMCYLWGAVANIIAAFFGSSTEAVGVSTVNDLFVNLENKPRRLC